MRELKRKQSLTCLPSHLAFVLFLLIGLGSGGIRVACAEGDPFTGGGNGRQCAVQYQSPASPHSQTGESKSNIRASEASEVCGRPSGRPDCGGPFLCWLFGIVEYFGRIHSHHFQAVGR
jgi:hypothetical protein